MAENTKIEWCDSTKCYGVNPLTGRPGPAPKPPESGNKAQARQRINVEVRTGRRPHPNDLPCTDCNHIYVDGERRHEYDHFKGYEAAHHYDVQSVCTTCHAKRDSERKRQTHCKRGHEFSNENTRIAKNGTRHCLECERMHEKNRPPRGPEYWKAVNAKRKGKKAAGRLLDGREHNGSPEVTP